MVHTLGKALLLWLEIYFSYIKILELINGKMDYRADSDAIITKGIIGLLIRSIEKRKLRKQNKLIDGL